ncbi:MAG: DUF4926 domain-containing protein [Anaerolineae bacterium]|nr:DUF4926 domain-containing protein [Anaerolineae bacterium]
MVARRGQACKPSSCWRWWRGQVGTVVEVLDQGRALEVEFSDREGHIGESLGLRPDQIIVRRDEPMSAPG